MSVALLDINDCNLQLWTETGRLQSPGYALLENNAYRFGKPARSAARLQPRNINTRFWWQLSTEPLQPALGPARHTADLVHSQLLDMHREAGEPAELLIAVPSGMQREQLSLLLGIVQQCPFEVVGLVNRSVVLGSANLDGERRYHLEIQLHQAMISELEVEDDRIHLQRGVPLPGCGLLQLQERLVEKIAAAFIRQTRFDPRRQAATEQQLYDSLPKALSELGQGGDSNLEIKGYRARINSGDLASAGERLFSSASQVIGGHADSLMIDPIATLLPGLNRQFPEALTLAPDSLQAAAQQHLQQLVHRDQALQYITSLPCIATSTPAPETIRRQTEDTAPTPQPPPAAPEPAPTPAPTHLLSANCARPLRTDTALPGGGELIEVTGGWQLRGDGEYKVNGSDYRAGQFLRCGDIIGPQGEATATLIEVLPD